MATSRGLGEFGRRLDVIAKGIHDNVGRTVRKAALVVDQVAVMATPVDMGRARAGWITSVGAPTDGAPHGDQPGGTPEERGASAAVEALEQAAQAVAEYKLDQGSIFVVNNVEYIGELDKGSSQQAPAGMTAQAVAAGAAVLRDAKVLP